MRGGGRVREDCNGGPEGWGGSDRLGHSSHRIHPASPRPPGFSRAFPRDRGRCFPAALAPTRPDSSFKGGSAPPPRVHRAQASSCASWHGGQRPANRDAGLVQPGAGRPASMGLPPIQVLPLLAVASEQAELRGLVSPGAALRFSCPDPGQSRGRIRAGVISSQYGQDGGREHRWRKWGPLARPCGQSQGCGALGLRGWLSPACGSPRR